ncbi:Ig-like domain-containing protein [Aquimarina sp. 2201CG1-2-11]|uniref:Ig-like domain-containing protein n=1 Tax=Aquimarina discodermiae TaxID=3231043 RepID=UPI003462EBBC
MADISVVKKINIDENDYPLSFLGKIKDRIYFTRNLKVNEPVIIITDIDLNVISVFKYTYVRDSTTTITLTNIIDTDENEFLVKGVSYSGPDQREKHTLLFKINDQENILWSKTYKNQTTGSGYTCLKKTGRGNYVFQEQELVVVVDENGNTLKSRTMSFSGRLSVHNDLIVVVAPLNRATSNNGILSIAILDEHLESIERYDYLSDTALPLNEIRPISIDTAQRNDKLIVLLKYKLSLITFHYFLLEFPVNSSQPIRLSVKKFESINGFYELNADHVDDGIYWNTRVQQENLNIHKFDSSFNHLWGKSSQNVKAHIGALRNNSIIEDNGNTFFMADITSDTGVTKNAIVKTKQIFQSECISTENKNSLVSVDVVLNRQVSLTNFFLESVIIPDVDVMLQSSISNFKNVQICPVSNFDSTKSIISANPKNVIANGTSKSIVTVQLKDDQGINLSTGGERVIILTSIGAITSTVDNNDGTYTAELTSNRAGSAKLTFTVNGATNPQFTMVSFYNALGCSVDFTIQVNQAVIAAEGRYKPQRDSSVSWVVFDINDIAAASTPVLNAPGYYNLEVRVQGANQTWTEWFVCDPFVIGCDNKINPGIDLEIGVGGCFTEIARWQTVYIVPLQSNTFQIDNGQIFYSDNNLTILYNGGDRDFRLREGNRISPYSFKINTKGVVYDKQFCAT